MPPPPPRDHFCCQSLLHHLLLICTSGSFFQAGNLKSYWRQEKGHGERITWQLVVLSLWYSACRYFSFCDSKLLRNTVFGKLLNPWSIIWAPAITDQTLWTSSGGLTQLKPFIVPFAGEAILGFGLILLQWPRRPLQVTPNFWKTNTNSILPAALWI